jgi:hypothetical protein
MARHFVYIEVQEPVSEAQVGLAAKVTLTHADGTTEALSGTVAFIAMETPPVPAPTPPPAPSGPVSGTIEGTVTITPPA